jgi:hypothetical protein
LSASWNWRLVAILDVSGMNDGVEQQTQRIYQNVALLPLIFLPAS